MQADSSCPSQRRALLQAHLCGAVSFGPATSVGRPLVSEASALVRNRLVLCLQFTFSPPVMQLVLCKHLFCRLTCKQCYHHRCVYVWDRKQSGSGVDSEWSRLLMEQQRLQQAEVHRWRQVLFSSIQLVEQMQRTLRDLHDGVMRRADDIVALTEQAKRDIDLAGATLQQAEEAGTPS